MASEFFVMGNMTHPIFSSLAPEDNRPSIIVPYIKADSIA
jgi:hypothetical protein